LIVVIIFNATFVPFCKQVIEECDILKRFYHIAMSSKHSRRRLLLQILLQNQFMNGQNGCLQSVGWLVGWLTCAFAH